MVKYLFTVILSLLLYGCTSTRIGENPVGDAHEMMYSAMSAFMNDDPQKANEIFGQYLDYYRDNATPEDQALFCKASTESNWYNDVVADDDPEWNAFLNKIQPLMDWYMESPKSLTVLSNYNQLRRLQRSCVQQDNK